MLILHLAMTVNQKSRTQLLGVVIDAGAVQAQTNGQATLDDTVAQWPHTLRLSDVGEEVEVLVSSNTF